VGDYKTTEIVFDGIDSPDELIALTLYSNLQPVGWFVNFASLFRAVDVHCGANFCMKKTGIWGHQKPL
jgi:hypothetical protein